MDRVNDVVKDCLDAVVQLRATEPAQLPPPENVHQRLKDFVEQMLRKAADVGFSHQDGQDIAFAAVALIDEVALTKGEAMRQHWQTAPLQMHFFNENVAGETFFSKLQALRGDSNRAEAVRAYYLCLGLGFQGKYRVRGGELELVTLVDGLAKEVQRHRTYDLDTLSPSGERPSESLVSAKKIGPLLILSGAAVALALVVYGALLLTLGVSVNSAKEQIQAVGRTVGAPQAAGEEGR